MASLAAIDTWIQIYRLIASTVFGLQALFLFDPTGTSLSGLHLLGALTLQII